MREKLNANSLYDRICDVRIHDRYAKCNKVFNNITEMLINRDEFRVHLGDFCDVKYNTYKLSDFEMFSVWERAHHLCAGMGEARVYQEGLALLGLDTPAFDVSDEDLRERWRSANTALSELCFDALPKNSDTVYLNEFVSDFVTLHRNSNLGIDDALAELKKAVKAFVNKDIHVIFNVSGMEYERPDPYHARILFEHAKCGEKYNDSFVIDSQLVVSLANELKDKKIHLHLYSDNGYTAIRALIIYLSEHSALEGEIKLGVFADRSADEWLNICRAQTRLKVTPELLLRACDLGIGLSDRLVGLFERYPIGLMRFGGTLDVPMPEAAHAILKKALAEYLSAVCDEPLAAQDILERFFEDQ